MGVRRIDLHRGLYDWIRKTVPDRRHSDVVLSDSTDEESGVSPQPGTARDQKELKEEVALSSLTRGASLRQVVYVSARTRAPDP